MINFIKIQNCIKANMKYVAIFAILIALQICNIKNQVFAQNVKPEQFKPTFESFKNYKMPEWFRDAKFGIWAHWGPQAVPRQGDWYAKKLYQQGSPDYKYHVEHYGHPSKFGYKDIIPLWKAERWNPEQLMALYKKAGAKYFVSMGTHHDNFFLWNSSLHKWNTVNMGPKRDVVGDWQKAAKKEGLRFGVSEHLAASYTWFQTSHGADTSGPYKGIPYDGTNPEYQDLYHPKAAADDKGWLSKNLDWQKEWLASVTELIDNYHPDLLYSDSGFPFDSIGREMVAHYYNSSILTNKNRVDVVYNCKQASKGMWVQDVERGVMDSISLFPWQTDTSIGDWYYRDGQKYKTSEEVIGMLVDIVSKNGNLLLNIVQTPEGDVEPDLIKSLEEIAAWIKVNGDGVYGTRPWNVYGEGPSTIGKQEKGQFGGLKDVRKYQPTDLRFTTKNGNLYIFTLGKPVENISVKSLSSSISQKIKSIQMLGSKEKLTWNQSNEGLSIVKPKNLPSQNVVCFKVSFVK
jgi:alpha-L-fucosidase